MAYTESNLVNLMSAFDYALMLKIKIIGESMTGPDHYRAARGFDSFNTLLWQKGLLQVLERG